MQIELSKQDAAFIQNGLATTVAHLQRGIRETNVAEAQVAYATTINKIRELQSRIAHVQEG